MNKFEKSQILMLSLLAVLLTIAPLLSSSLRTTYLYIITNLLIIALGAQAGLLSAFSKPSDDKRNTTVSAAPKPLIASELASSDKRVVAHNDEDQRVASECPEKNPRVIETSKSEKISGTVVKLDHSASVKKCPSMPSLFFIGSYEADQGDDDDEVENYNDVEEEEVSDLSGQELFAKAETFIGNFYKQLKMQREESWKKIHGFYQKAF